MDALRRQAKRWLRALRANDAAARDRLHRAHPTAPAHPTLRDVQHALAREYGYENWLALTRAHEKAAADAVADSPATYARIVNDLLLAFNDRDAEALRRLNAIRGTSFTHEDLAALIWGRVYAYRQRASRGPERYLLPDEARTLIAQNAGYASWDALTAKGPSRPARVPAYEVTPHESRIAPRRQMDDAEWDAFVDAVQQQRISNVEVHALLTDALLGRLADFDHILTLRIGGSRQLTDEGLRHLARMPQLQHLTLSAYPGGHITDRGLEVLRHLKALRTFEMTWQKGISDDGVKHLAACDALERVDVMGTDTGDGLIEALAGKPHLVTLQTGRLVTDRGLAALQRIPRLVDSAADDARLLIDGPFTNAGFAQIASLTGVGDLVLFWHVSGITSDAFAHLASLPRLTKLGADRHLSDDTAMRHFAAIPNLRGLMAQESAATDAGFEALSRSTTLEGFWGRECPNFGGRGFVALSRMPALRSLGVGCRNVADAALALFPEFPALRELTPIGVRDAGFRHIGRCARLERLSCMYCRDTTDAATEHITSLPLKHYYAGLTQITDRTLELLGTIGTLEEIEFYECMHITDRGLPALAHLPRLRKIEISSSPGVTLAGMGVFAPRVRVRYST
jgi:hypothetical protein